MRLQQFLAQAGVAARRKAEELIVSGVVTVNGKVVTELGTRVDPEADRVQVHGEAVYPQEFHYIVLNKPKGCVTTVSDPQGRPTVMDYLPRLPVQVKPVGRLDYYSEGVLLLTNDGELAARLLAPGSHVEKTYHVKLRGRLSQQQMTQMRNGVRLDDGTVTQPAQVDRLSAPSKHDWLVITLTEGKSRQIHRMAEALGHEVLKLQRVAFAGITFHGLRVGDARELSQAEVNALRESAGLGRSPRAASRGKWQARREDTDVARRARARRREQEQQEQSVAGDSPAGERSVPPRRNGVGRTGPRDERGVRPGGRSAGGPPRGFGRGGEPARAGGRGAGGPARSAAARGTRPGWGGGAGEGTGPRGFGRGGEPARAGGRGAGGRSAGGPPRGFGRGGEPARAGGRGAGGRPGGRGGEPARAGGRGAGGPARSAAGRGARPGWGGGAGEGTGPRGFGRGEPPRAGGRPGGRPGPAVRVRDGAASTRGPAGRGRPGVGAGRPSGAKGRPGAASRRGSRR